MFSLKDFIDLIVDRFRAIINTEKEKEPRELMAVYEYKITEEDLFEYLLRAVVDYDAVSVYSDDRDWRLSKTKKSVIMEHLISSVESFGYEVVHGNDFKNIKVRKNED